MMERKNRLEYLQLRNSGKSLQEIANMFGVSKQRVHEVLSEKSKREKRTELRQEITRLESELSALRDQNARLRTALEQIASKSDPERPKKWDAEMDTSFGITLGWWSAGQIARKALDDLRQAAKEGEG